MFALPGRLASPALQRSGAFLNYVNDICTELCDAIQTNVTKVYEGLNSPARQKPTATSSCEQTPKAKCKYVFVLWYGCIMTRMAESPLEEIVDYNITCCIVVQAEVEILG